MDKALVKARTSLFSSLRRKVGAESVIRGNGTGAQGKVCA